MSMEDFFDKLIGKYLYIEDYNGNVLYAKVIGNIFTQHNNCESIYTINRVGGLEIKLNQCELLPIHFDTSVKNGEVKLSNIYSDANWVLKEIDKVTYENVHKLIQMFNDSLKINVNE